MKVMAQLQLQDLFLRIRALGNVNKTEV